MPPSPRTSRRRAALITALVAAFLMGFSASPVEAEWESPWRWYTGKNNCTDKVDPITFVFKGTKADAFTAADKVQKATGWTPSGGSTQSFYTHGACRDQQAQRASGCNTCDRRDHQRGKIEEAFAL